MSHIIPLTSSAEVSRVLDHVDFVLSDCDGVLYLSKTRIPGTEDTIRKLRERGKKVLFVTNNGAVSRKTAVAKLNGLGFEASFRDIFTPSFVVAQYLKSKNFDGKVFVMGEGGLRDELEEAGIASVGVGPDPFPEGAPDKLIPEVPQDETIRAVVVGFDHFISLPKLVKVCTYARHVQPQFFLATNCDVRQPTPNLHQVWPETGPFISFVETAVGYPPLVFGKPNQNLWTAIKQVYPSIQASRTVMLGDNMETDIAFGNNNGFKFTVLVGTGIHKLSDAELLEADDTKRYLIPSHYTPALTDLNSLL